MIHAICPATGLTAPKPVCLHGPQAATLKGSSQEALVDARLFCCRKYHCAGGAELRCSWQEPRNMHWAAEQLKSNARGSFLPPPLRGGRGGPYPGAARCSFQREHLMLEGAATRQSRARLPRMLGRPGLRAAAASGEATLTKPRQPHLLPGRRGEGSGLARRSTYIASEASRFGSLAGTGCRDCDPPILAAPWRAH